MDIGNFVPQHLKDYYEIANKNQNELNYSLDTRKPYRSVSKKSSAVKLSKSSKRDTQQFNFSRNFHPLKDITQDETNRKNLFGSYQPKAQSNSIKENTNENTSNRSPLEQFNFTVDVTQKCSTRSLAKRSQPSKASKKLFNFTQKFNKHLFSPAQNDIDSLNDYQNYNQNLDYAQNQEDSKEGTSSHEMGKLSKKLQQAEMGYHKWKKCAEKQNKSIMAYEKKVKELYLELKKSHKRVIKYKQLKDYSDSELIKFKESQKDILEAHTVKIKRMFLKEYEELITDNTNNPAIPQDSIQTPRGDEIAELTGKLTKSNLELRKLQSQIKELTKILKHKDQEIQTKENKIKGKFLNNSQEIDISSSKVSVDPILREGLQNMEKCNRINSDLLIEYKEHITRLTSQNAALNKQVNTLVDVEKKYIGVKQQNEIYEKDLKQLEDTLKVIEGQTDAELCTKVQQECECLCKDTMQLIDCLTSVQKGQEPNIDILLGFKPNCESEIREMASTYKEIRTVRKKLNDMRNSLCDHYATEYSSECHIQ
ncbi:unnamed protein product [Moneuplotes crassus]|uniref:Uncharacterized protein n=1 Tax=Euplotes crassus TaxID=5936 RepID=A0AAD1UGL8_EUPCR|nr:unnamed protein product [Moneuplotes crassus]